MKNLPAFISSRILQLTYVAAIIFITSCHHPKSISTTTTSPSGKTQTGKIDGNAKALLQHLKNNELQFSELTARMKTKVSSPSLNQSFTTNIRWKKGEKIWMSMSIIGIEGGRV